jgi:hypothetical protein
MRKVAGRIGRSVIPPAALLIVLTVIVAVWRSQEQQLAAAQLGPRDFFTLQNAFAATAAQMAGGAILLVGLFFTGRQLAHVEKSLALTQEGQITERFTRAVEQLGSGKPEIRLGAIYAFERIAQDSERDYWPVMEILTTFVREQAHWVHRRNGGGSFWGPIVIVWLIARDARRSLGQADRASFWGYQPPRADIQAALTVIGRRRWRYRQGEQWKLGLRETDLRGVNLEGAHLEGADLALAHLNGARLTRAHLQGANLVFAQLQGAQVQGADFQDAYLHGANVGGTDLREATGLTWDQIESTNGYRKARLPDYLQMQKGKEGGERR